MVGGEVCVARRNWPRGRPVSAYVVSCVGFRRCALIQSSENWRLLGLRRTANLRDEPGKAAKLVALESSYVIMIFTIGYEGIDLTRFMSLLSHHDIETVVDVREMPLSRKRGFSKTALKTALHQSGFEYIHLAMLGCPKDIRNRYREDGDWAAYRKRFLRYLATQESAIAELAALSSDSNCALLCFEADHNFCHRSMVANAVSDIAGTKVTHISATPPTRTARPASLEFAWADR